MDIIPILGLATLGTIFSGIGIYSQMKRKKFEGSGLSVMGTVEEIVTDYNGNSKIYYPVINYTTIDKREIEKEYHIGSYPAVFKKGEEVQVIYLADSPTDFIIAGKFTRAMELIFSITGVACVISALILYFTKV
jgi:hypothetical protein